MTTFTELTVLAAAVGSGLVAGLCFAFAAFIMTAFDRLGPASAIRAMQSINATILRSSAMVAWMGTAIVGILAAVLTEQRFFGVAAAALYCFGALLITGRGNVPLNEELDHVDAEAAGAEEAWRRYRVRWQRFNLVRTIALSLATAGFALAL